MWLRTFILLTLAISAFGHVCKKNFMGDILTRDVCNNTRAEIVFIIDGSRSIYIKDFHTQIVFLEKFVASFKIGPESVRFGAVTFGSKVIKENTFRLSRYTKKTQLIEAISNIDYRNKDGGSTQTDDAIKYARKALFSNSRKYTKKIAIVITDGLSTEPKKTAIEAKAARESGIMILAIGVGQNASKEELKIITAREDFVFMVDKYSMLETIKNELSNKTCSLQDQPPCEKEIDIIFVLAPSILGDKSTHDVAKFMKRVIPQKDHNKNNIKFGVVAGPCNNVMGFQLDSYQYKTAISHFDQFHEASYAPLLKETLEESFSIAKGGRVGARKVAVIFLKGKLNDPIKVAEKANALRDSDIEVFVVKMDSMNSWDILETITSESNILDATSETTMVHLSSELSTLLCKR